jgi:predicted small metal-binding protein
MFPFLKLAERFKCHLHSHNSMILPSFPVNSGHEIATGLIQNTPVVSFCCRDIGMDCSFESTGSTESGVLKEFILHAELSHDLDVLPAELLFKIKGSIKKNSFT